MSKEIRLGRFKKCVGRIMETLERAGIEDLILKASVRKSVWLLHDDLVLMDDE